MSAKSAPANRSGRGIMALGGSLANYRGHLDDFGYVVFSSEDAGLAERLPGVTLVYTSPSIINDGFSNEVPWAQAKANGWLLTDSAGNYVHPYRDEHEWACDVGSTGYQQATIHRLLGWLSGHRGVKGVELDNIVPDVAYFSSDGSWPTRYPNAPAWQRAQVAFVGVVGRALRARGYYVMVNATGYIDVPDFDGGGFDQRWWRRLARTRGVSAIFAEDWLENPNDAAQLMDDSRPGGFMTSWSGWQRLVSTAQSNGVDFVGIMNGPDPAADPTTAHHLMRFGRGSFLLDWNGKSGMFGYAIGSVGEYSGRSSWDPAWTTSIGTPTGKKYRIARDVWRRDYTRGVVVVNPTSGPFSTTVNGTSYTVGPQDALILPA